MEKRSRLGNTSYIGIFNDSFPPIMDGVTLTVENYAHWLHERGYTPCVVTPWNPRNIKQPFKVMKFFSLPIQGRAPYRYGYPKLDPFIWHRLRTTPFQLVHSHCPFSSGRLAVYAKRKQNVPLIGTFHSKYRDDLEHWFAHSPWMVRIIMKRILHFFNSCDQVWIPQAKVEDAIREYGYKGKVEVVENGSDFADLSVTELPLFKQSARESRGIKREDLSLLFVGQHIWEKGIDIILDAVTILIEEGLPIKMTFVGDGYAKKELLSRIKSRGLGNNIETLDVITDRSRLKEMYASADLFLFPSFYDNAPLVVREAAAMGTPGILLRDSTAAEIITDGKNGFLTNKDAQSYANVIRKLNDDRTAIKEAGLCAHNTLVRSWENVVDEVIGRYKEILRK